MGTEPLVFTKAVKHKQDWTFGAKKLTIHTQTEKELKLAIVFVPIHEGETVRPEALVYEDLANWKTSEKKEATLANVQINKTLIPHFDKRQFTYIVDVADKAVPTITAKSEQKGGKVAIKQEKGLPNKATITVTAADHKTSVYTLYFREKPAQILKTSILEYSSWDESFANHRISAKKMATNDVRDYELKDATTIQAMTMGISNQGSKGYKFEVWASNDQKTWNLVHQGISKKVQGIKMAMPQLFTFKPFTAKYIRIKNTDDSPNFAIDILRFHKTEASANEYINHAYKDVMSDVLIPKEIKLKIGGKQPLNLEGLSNYGKKFSLTDAKTSFESENTEAATVSSTGEIEAKANGVSYIRIVVQKGDYVFHKKVAVTVE